LPLARWFFFFDFEKIFLEKYLDVDIGKEELLSREYCMPDPQTVLYKDAVSERVVSFGEMVDGSTRLAYFGSLS
jgi:hypothetical protein